MPEARSIDVKFWCANATYQVDRTISYELENDWDTKVDAYAWNPIEPFPHDVDGPAEDLQLAIREETGKEISNVHWQ